MRAVNDFRPGLEGVIAFETEIAEPDKEGSALRYRGVDIEELVGHYPFEQVWGLLVDGSFEPGMPKAERIELQDPSGSVMADLQAALATLGSKWGLRQLVDIEAEQARDDLARLSAATLSIVAQSARGDQPAVPESEIEQGENAAAQFLIRWRGEADPKHVEAVDTYWVSAAEHGLNSSTFTARIVASTGADCAAAMSSAVGALSGPLHGGAPDARAEDARRGRAARRRRRVRARHARPRRADHGLRPPRLPRRGSARARAAPDGAGSSAPSASRSPRRSRRPRCAALREKSPDRVLETNVEFWAAVVLEIADIPPPMYPPMFGCARVAGWSAHIIEQRRTGRLIRPSARYVGPPVAPRDRVGLTTLAEAAAEANAFAEAGLRARARRPAREVGRGARLRRALVRLPRARRRLPRDRPVPLPPEDRADPPRPRGREPGVPRLGAALARAALARPSRAT